MMNIIWVLFVLGALVCGALTGHLDSVAKATIDSCKSSVELALGLVGVMTFFLGLMRALQDGGVLKSVARALRPVLVRLFPDVPADHPALSMMIMNFTANMLGLANAATPFGLKAMMELDKLNPQKGVATDSMALFLAINTSGLALLPTGIIGVRAALGSHAAGAIFLPTLLATICSTTAAIVITKLLIRSKRWPAPQGTIQDTEPNASTAIDVSAAVATLNKDAPAVSRLQTHLTRLAAIVLLLSLAFAVWTAAQSPSELGTLGWLGAIKKLTNDWALVILIGTFVLIAMSRGVPVYESMVEGGKEGFSVALRIMPYLVAILVAVGMLRASGALDMCVGLVAPIANAIGMPPETLPMVFIRPLSGSGALGVASEIMKTYGADSLVGQIVSTMNGSTETTFYVLAVYYGAVHVTHTRFTLIACLVADAVGMLGSVWFCRWLLT